MKIISTNFIFVFVIIFFGKEYDQPEQFNNSIVFENEQEDHSIGKYPNDIEYIKRTFPYYTADPDAHLRALDQAKEMKLTVETDNPVPTWQFAGPVNIGGRISDLEYDPNNGNIVYAGAATGGIFKSTDAGLTWNPVFDEQAVLPIGDIAVDPVNSNIIYVGTGEANGGHNNFAGGGIYKSTDAGVTWQLSGLESTVSIGRIVIDPLNPQKIFVAAVGSYFGPNPERGIYSSDNAGVNWSKILFVTDSTGAIDIAMDPVNPNNLLAAMWQRTRYPNGGQLFGPTSGIYKTTNGGNNWTALGAANGLPNSGATNVGRIGISISKSNPSIAYSLFTNGTSYLGFFKTTNAGLNWTNANPGGTLQNGFSTFSWYFGNVRVHPANPDIVYVLDYAIMRSTNSGTTWTNQTSGGIHVDNHALAFKPENPSIIIEGNDGGIYNSTNGGTSYSKVSSLPITQYYEIGLDKNNPLRLYGGTQDNGTNRTTTGALNNWTSIYGGDGFYVIVDHTNPNIIYAESQNGGFGKSTNGGTSFSSATNGINGSEKRNWSTPVVMDPNNNNVLYFGTNKVYRTTNAASLWVANSPDLTNGNQARLGTVTTIAVAPSNSSVVIAGTDDANVWITTNTGASWTKVSTTLPYRWVTRVAFDPVNENIAYVTYNGLKWKDPQPHVFRTTNKGVNWTDISNNLPDAPVNAFAIDPLRPNVLFVGSDVGAYVSFNTGQSWQFLGTGLPMVSVYDFKVHPTANYLVAGTHGRSMYKIDLALVVGEVSLDATIGIEGMSNGTTQVQDTMRFYLRNSTSPFASVDSAKAYLSSSGNAIVNFSNASSGNYYIQTKHRNALETWNANALSFTAGGTTNFNFTTSQSQTFGNNSVLKSGRYCSYSGDVLDKGNIDVTDVVTVYNDATNFVSGYVDTDVTGDDFVDASDLLITYNNSINFVGVVRP